MAHAVSPKLTEMRVRLRETKRYSALPMLDRPGTFSHHPNRIPNGSARRTSSVCSLTLRDPTATRQQTYYRALQQLRVNRGRETLAIPIGNECQPVPLIQALREPAQIAANPAVCVEQYSAGAAHTCAKVGFHGFWDCGDWIASRQPEKAVVILGFGFPEAPRTASVGLQR